jgi:hypothetical protein
MVTDVIFHQFSHQTVDGSAGGGEALQHFRALFVIIQGSEDGFELADDLFCAVYQINFFCGGMGHPGTPPQTGYSTQPAGTVQYS